MRAFPWPPPGLFFFFFNDTATTEIYTLSLHDALPISPNISGVAQVIHYRSRDASVRIVVNCFDEFGYCVRIHDVIVRSEEHTSELQSPCNLVCRLLLEKKKNRASAMIVVTSCISLADA